MSRWQRLLLFVIAGGIAGGGVWLLMGELSWKALAGLALILWANNISQSRVEWRRRL